MEYQNWNTGIEVLGMRNGVLGYDEWSTGVRGMEYGSLEMRTERGCKDARYLRIV